MKNFLYAIAIVGLVEFVWSIAFLMMDQIPARTEAGVFIDAVCWGWVLVWAISLIREQK